MEVKVLESYDGCPPGWRLIATSDNYKELEDRVVKFEVGEYRIRNFCKILWQSCGTSENYIGKVTELYDL
jgi:hypothetical protein